MDKYDRQIEKLTKHPELINDDWLNGIGLFSYAVKLGSLTKDKCGCLTQIKGLHGFYTVQGRPDLADRIRSDPRIPRHSLNISVESLPVFAEWQRILDRELDRSY